MPIDTGGKETLHDVDIPGQYGADRFEDGIPQSLAIAYERLASDIRSGTQFSPIFEDAVDLHRLLAKIERSSGDNHG